MLANKALSAAPSAVPVYVEDIFSSYLYTGNGSTQTITNNIDLSTKGGLVWLKNRTTGATNHILTDSARGIAYFLRSNLTNAQDTNTPNFISSFNTNGFGLGTSASEINASSNNYVSWTFAKQPKFFDVVTYTGNGSAPRNIAHSLGSSPGCIMIKRTDSTGNWWVWHRSTPNANANLYLDATDAADTGANPMISAVSSTNFTLATNQNATMNINNATYVAYLFAHDAGGFGASGSDSVIKCGSFTSNSSGDATITLDWEPQWLMIKSTSVADNWYMLDNMRALVNGSQDAFLNANITDAEVNYSQGYVRPSATGFTVKSFGNTVSYVYIAIRRGPMKTPTSGTSVFSPVVYTSGSSPAFTAGFPPDLAIQLYKPGAAAAEGPVFASRLQGTVKLQSSSTAVEASEPDFVFYQNGFRAGSATSDYAAEMFRRAPGFFDVVCYTGNGTAGRTVSHNLTVTPEMMIVKDRNFTGGRPWTVYHSALGATQFTYMNQTATPTTGNQAWNDTAPTASVFTLGSNSIVNFSGTNYVAYLFASLTGVSKVGTYTGNGTSQTINCGFTAGARFVLIKRTDSTGDWYVFDTARGIVTGNDPFLLLNSTAAEVTTRDAVDPDNSGFIVNNDATNFPINVNAATYIYLAIA